MKKFITILFLSFFFNNSVFADQYYFKDCKLSNVAKGDYIINLKKNVIEATLSSQDGRVQNFTDKIKTIKKDRIITEKIESGEGDQIYFEYHLDSKKKKMINIKYKKQSGPDIEVFKIQQVRESECSEVKGDWDLAKIQKVEINKEKTEILKAQEKMKKEQSTIPECKDNDYKKWNNCNGFYKSQTGHTYEGLFKNGEITKGIAIFPGGSKYVGEFLSFKPHGYGNFAWKNGDKYFGEWKNGKSNGDGTKIWNDGREYSGKFKDDKLNGMGTFYYPDGKKFVGEFLNGKRHGEGTFTYPDGTAFIGKFVSGKQQGLGECIDIDGSSKPCKSKAVTQTKNFSGKNIKNINIVAKKWVRVSQYETNTKKGKKVMDKLKTDFDIKASELCSSIGKYKVLKKNIDVLDIDETPAYGLETKLQLGINGVIECEKI